jgi:hypothetical protein
MFFKKKIKGPIKIALGEGQFYKSWEADQQDCAYDLAIVTSSDHYNLVYQNGDFCGMPLNGGKIYPFSYDPTRKGSRGDKKDFATVKVVCVTAGAALQVDWGVFDKLAKDKKENGKPYLYGAHGTFIVEVNPADAAGNADKFYRKLCVQSNGSEMDADGVRNKLKVMFENKICEVIEDVFDEQPLKLSEFIGIDAREANKISKEVYKKIKDIFTEFGLTINKVASESAIVNQLTIREYSK